MKPTEILENRIECYKKCDPGAIFDFYAQCSEFRRFFPEKDGYLRHFDSLDAEHGPVSIEVFRETEKENTAEVLYIETFNYGGTVKRFFSKTSFILENNVWKIKSELREEEKPED